MPSSAAAGVPTGRYASSQSTSPRRTPDFPAAYACVVISAHHFSCFARRKSAPLPARETPTTVHLRVSCSLRPGMPLHLNEIVYTWLSMDVIVTCSTYTRYWSLLGSPNMHKYHAAFHRYDVHPANDPGAAARSPSTRDAMGSLTVITTWAKRAKRCNCSPWRGGVS